MERKFLGWDGMPLDAAADWLTARFAGQMRGVIVALPGARAGRLLLEKLARAAGANLQPPTVVTGGQLSDQLLELSEAPASRLVRTFAWREALRTLDPRSLARLVARPPLPEDLAGWVRLAEEVRGLFGEVAAEGLDFHRVAEDETIAGVEGERWRWRALAEAQDAMQRSLAAAGFVDPHLARLAAIDADTLRPRDEVREVVLVGIVEMNALTRRALEHTAAPATALVLAPESEADRFDDTGALETGAWSKWRTGLDHERHWRVVDGPVDQAHAAVRAIASWSGAYRAEQVTIGLADAEVSPHLKGGLAELGVVARDAAGTALTKTAPVLLLGAVARFLGSRDFSSFAELVRHPDFEAALRRGTSNLEPVSLVDDYHNAHLPWRADGSWLAEKKKQDLLLHEGMQLLWDRVVALLGELEDQADERPIPAAVPALRRMVEAVYGKRTLEPGVESDRVLVESLRQIGAGLSEIEELPEALAPVGSVAATIETLLSGLGTSPVPPAPARAGEPTIELLGWLELALDDAPALVVTGFEDGKVPESVRGDAYLPNALRKSLGLADNEKRLARDLYATELLIASRDEVVFLTGRRSLAGDPQVPSRIVFHCEPDEVVPRVKRFLHGEGAPNAARPSAGDEKKRELPRAPVCPKLEKIAITAFRTYLASPYLYYLERALGLRTLDDRARELDPRNFGTLAHAVLQRFGENARVRDESDGEKLAAFFSAELERLGQELYGEDPLPAVRLQLEQLDYRLRAFAQVQAERRRTGWRIHATEWSPAAGHHELVVDGEPVLLRGQIDRIDHNETTGAWAIWDYKTGENAKAPAAAHRNRAGEWIDLQLPLYCVLAAELIGEEPPAELGYASLVREADKVAFQRVKNWGGKKGEEVALDEGIGAALEVAQDVVRRIRREEFFSADGFAPADRILGAIGGMGLVLGTDAEAEGEDEG